MGTGGGSPPVLRTTVATSISEGALPGTVRWSDRQQLNRLAPAARSGPRSLVLAGVKLAQTCLDLMRAKP